MQTDHRVVVDNARNMQQLDRESVELIVTSPPYPMIEMWDALFAELDPEIGSLLESGAGADAFDRMHDQLDRVWDELERVLVDGGIACINIGDATRTVGGSFRVYPNRSRIVSGLCARGFEPLPEIVWRKPTNAATKFMGSGMVPPNAYVTLEHEYILVFRKGSARRSFEPGAADRYNAAYFWEERNEWFSDLWTDIRGTQQATATEDLRERSGAYPFAIPYRLINMYSAYGDTVLDPFWGTGTTTLAAMVAARDSIGYELESAFVEAFADRAASVDALSRRIGRSRLREHDQFARDRRADGEELGYHAAHYDTPVMTKQERRIRLYKVDQLCETDTGWTATHSPIEWNDRLADSGGDRSID